MSAKPVLKLNWCSHEAAKYAVEHWHYSKSMPAGKSVKIGAWESEIFVGVVIFSWGANKHIGSPYGLQQTEICELVRVAFYKHNHPVSRLVTLSLKMLVQQSPGLRLIVSYADPEQGHHGGIYQAMNWLYVGSSQPQRFSLRQNGQILHKRTAHSRYGTIKGLEKSKILWKHKYLYPLDADMRAQIIPLAKPYPKRAASILADAPAVQAGESGAAPTAALSVSE